MFKGVISEGHWLLERLLSRARSHIWNAFQMWEGLAREEAGTDTYNPNQTFLYS